MRSTRQISITLPHEMADQVRARVNSGEYASESEVIREGLRALNARDRALEHWLRTEGVASYDAYKAEPANLHDVEDIQSMLDEEWERAGKAV